MDETLSFHFNRNQVGYRTYRLQLLFLVKPRKKEIFLKEKWLYTSISCKEFHRELNRVMRVIKAYYRF